MAFSNTAAVFPGTGNITISSGAVVAGGYSTIGSWLPNIASSSAGVLALTGSDTETVNMTGYSSLVIGASGAATFSGSFTPAGSNYLLGGGNGTLTFTPALTGGSGLTAFGGGSGGTLILTASNNYTGSTTINSGGTLTIKVTRPRPLTADLPARVL